MRRWIRLATIAGLGLLFPACGVAQDSDKKPPQAEAAKTPADELAGIQQDYNKKQQEFMAAFRAAKTQEDKQRIARENRPDFKPFLDRVLKLAAAHPEHASATDGLMWALQMSRDISESKKVEGALIKNYVEKVSLKELSAKFQHYSFRNAPTLMEAILAKVEANADDKDAPKLLAWIHRSTMYASPSPVGDKVTKLLFEKFVNDDVLASVCQNLGNMGERNRHAAAQLRSVLDRSTNKKVLASANFGLAMVLKEQDASKQKEAEELFEKVIKEFGPENKILAQQATSELREIRLLGIGKTVPEIEGLDLQDKNFRISDYRGKVVLLDFWGFW
jgi:hypothetical protein